MGRRVARTHIPAGQCPGKGLKDPGFGGRAGHALGAGRGQPRVKRATHRRPDLSRRLATGLYRDELAPLQALQVLLGRHDAVVHTGALRLVAHGDGCYSLAWEI